MAKQQLEVKGKREVTRAFDRLADDSNDLTPAHSEIASKVLGDIQRRTRRRTGTLQAGWGADPEAQSVRFTNPLRYALPQEYGAEGRNISPTNAVRLAFEAHADDITEAYGDDLRSKAKRANLRTK